jgi:hypothetical protein
VRGRWLRHPGRIFLAKEKKLNAQKNLKIAVV